MQITSLLRRQPRARDAVRHHLGVAKDRRAGGQRAARRRDEIAAEHDVRRRLDLAAGMDHAHRDVGFLGRKARQIGLGADDGERALIDRRAVAQIGGALRHGRPRVWSRAYFAIAAGNSSAATTVNGASRAEPLAMSAHPPGVPTTVSAAARDARSPWRSRKYES